MRIILQFLLLALIAMSSSSYAETANDASCQKIFNHFSKDDQYVYYRGTRLFSADPKTFEIIKNSDYSKDANFVYYETIRIADADPETFELVNNNDDYQILGKDKYRVYMRETVIEGANPQYFAHIKGSFYKDDRYVFYYGEQLKNAAPKEFILYFDGWGGLGRDNTSFYSIGRSLHGEYSIYISRLKDLGIDNPDQLINLEGYYFKYNNQFYILTSTTFDSLKIQNSEDFEYIGNRYFKDRDTVYYHQTKYFDNKWHSQLININADFKSFQYSNNHYVPMAQDKQSCFSAVERVACGSFTQEQEKSASYKANKSNKIKILANCDNKLEYSLTENPFNSVPLSISNNEVSYNEITIKNVDIPNFEYIGSMNSYRISDQNYFRDKNHVYLNGKIIKGVDPKTFVLLSDLRARDKNQILTRSTLELLTEKE